MGYIQLDNISFRYSQQEPYILNGFCFSAEKGECLIVRGDNGAGKTTLFRILTGLSFPEKGEYCFDGVKITKDYLKNNKNSKLFHKKIGYLFQNPDIMLFNSTVRDEIAFGPRQMGLTEHEISKRVNSLLELFNLENLAGKAPYHLSEGQKKRVALAAVMSLNPDVLILDEPDAGLDSKTQAFLTDFFGELKSAGKTLIAACHSEQTVSLLADKTVVLSGNNF